jgi:hypothetical protein
MPFVPRDRDDFASICAIEAWELLVGATSFSGHAPHGHNASPVMANLNGSDRQVPSHEMVLSIDAARGHTEPKFVHAVDLVGQLAHPQDMRKLNASAGLDVLPYYLAETSSTEGLAGRPDAMTGAPE